GELVGLEREEEALQGLLRAPVGDMDDPMTAEIVDQRDEAEAPPQRLLVDADHSEIELTAGRKTALDRVLHDAVGLVPAHLQELRAAADARLTEHLHRECLEEEREARARLRPGHARLPDAVLGAIDARYPRADEGLKLAAVEVTPRPLVGVIVKAAELSALRA